MYGLKIRPQERPRGIQSPETERPGSSKIIQQCCKEKFGNTIENTYLRANKNKNKMKAEINVTSVTQTANELLGSKEKKLYYLIIDYGNDKTIINIGEKNYEIINKIINEKSKK